MEKPRIIIADTDSTYIASLQLKFIEEFFNCIELEIITDAAYFHELFSNPQNADILILSEELYDISIQKHNLSYIFLMTEQYEEEQTQDLKITKIFKYTSVKEIFNEILGKSADVLHIDMDNKNEPQIVVVTSASGGVGKTTVAMGICASLAKNYKKVLYINCDLLQNFQYLMKNNAAISNLDVYSNLLKSSRENIYVEIHHLIRNEGFHYIPPFKAAIMSVGLSKDIYRDIALSAKNSGEYDYIIVDTDGVFDEFKVDLFNLSNRVILVTKQNRMSVMALNRFVSNINGYNNEKYLCICNDFDKTKENALISPEYTLKYTVSEYVEHLPNYDQLKSSDFMDYIGFRKLSYLFL